MEPRLFVATKAFVMHSGKILIVRESDAYADGTNAGKYDLIGGRLNPGERLEEALRREVKEETGLNVEIGSPFFADESIPRPVVRGEEWQVVKIYFPCKSRSDQVTLSGDHNECLWIDPREYLSVRLIENLYPAFSAYLKTQTHS